MIINHAFFVSIMVNLCVFLSALPFLSFFPIQSDVQLPIYFLALLVVIFDMISNRFFLRTNDFIFLIISIISVFYINPFHEYEFDLASRLGLLLSFLVFYVISRYWLYVRSSYVISALVVNLLGAIVHFYFPYEWVTFVSPYLVNELRGTNMTGGRGVSGFAPEAGFLGVIAVYMLMLIYILYMEHRVRRRVLIYSFVGCLLLVLLSSSGSGVVLLFLFLSLSFILSSYSIFTKSVVTIAIVLTILMVLNTGILDYVTSRGVKILLTLFSSSDSILNDSSFFYRVIPMLTGVISIFDGNLLGSGAGSLPVVSERVFENHHFFNQYQKFADKVSGLGSSAFGKYTTELGLIFIVFLFLIYKDHNGYKYSYAVRGVSFTFVLASFAIVFPPLWVLLGATHNPYRKVYCFNIFK